MTDAKRIVPVPFLFALLTAVYLFLVPAVFLSARPVFGPAAVTPAKSYTVGTLQKAAGENNRDLLQLRVNEEETRTNLTSAKANRFPDIGAEIRLSHIANPIDPVSVTAGEFGSYTLNGQDILIPAEDVRLYDGMESFYYQFVVTLDQPIFTWGKISNSIELYKKALYTKNLQIGKKQQEINTTIRVYVYSLFYLKKIENIIEKQKKAADRLIFISEKAYENGFIVYTDLLDAKIKAREISLGASQADEQRDQLLIELRHITGIDHLGTENIDFSTIEEDLDKYRIESKDVLLNRALKGNMNLRLLRSMKEIADYKLQIAKGKNYLKPDIGLHFELSYGGPRFPFVETDWFGKDDYNLVSTLAFQTKLFDGGKLRSEIKMNEQELRSSGYDEEKGRQSVEKFISTTLLKISLNRDNIAYYKLKIENDREQMKIKKTQFDAGAGTETDYLLAMLNQYADMIRLYQETIQFFTNYFTLQNVAAPEQEPE